MANQTDLYGSGLQKDLVHRGRQLGSQGEIHARDIGPKKGRPGPRHAIRQSPQLTEVAGVIADEIQFPEFGQFTEANGVTFQIALVTDSRIPESASTWQSLFARKTAASYPSTSMLK